MNKLLLTFFALLCSLTIMGQSGIETTSKDGPKVTFQESKFNFGNIQQGQKVEHIFTFENNGTQPLMISEVITTCGCIVSEWAAIPVEVGKMGSIKVIFNSARKIGRQNKVVTIVSNAVNSEEKVVLKGNILP